MAVEQWDRTVNLGIWKACKGPSNSLHLTDTRDGLNVRDDNIGLESTNEPSRSYKRCNTHQGREVEASE